MFTAYIQWWDRHPWVFIGIIGVMVLVFLFLVIRENPRWYR